MTRWAIPVLVAAAALGTLHGRAADPEDRLRYRWYQVELLIFKNPPPESGALAEEGIAARPRLLETVRYPRSAFPLSGEPGRTTGYPFGPEPPVDDGMPLVISNLVPPAWFAGDCVTEFWTPGRAGDPFENRSAAEHDPCLPPDPWEVEHAGIGWAMDPGVLGPAHGEPAGDSGSDPADDRAEPTPDPDQTTLEELSEAFRQHEDLLLRESYVWRRETPRFADERSRLRRLYEVVAAGSWHQPVPAREQPQPLLVQVGRLDENRRPFLDGLFSVTLGRFIHLQVMLQIRLPGGDTALFSEHRRMRSDESHYLDHPALGILVRVDPLPLPEELHALADDFQERDE